MLRVFYYVVEHCPEDVERKIEVRETQSVVFYIYNGVNVRVLVFTLILNEIFSVTMNFEERINLTSAVSTSARK